MGLRCGRILGMGRFYTETATRISLLTANILKKNMEGWLFYFVFFYFVFTIVCLLLFKVCLLWLPSGGKKFSYKEYPQIVMLMP